MKNANEKLSNIDALVELVVETDTYVDLFAVDVEEEKQHKKNKNKDKIEI